MMKLTLTLVLLAGPSFAEEWKMRDGDHLFSASELKERLIQSDLVFYDEGRSVYGADGSYSYTYGGGGTWEGRFEAQDDSIVCVTFVTGSTRCDRIVENDGRLVVLTVEGERFPVRPSE
ncbi:hypothetical protein Q8W25_11505 [Shimia thalassica]|nr:hypothetical protein [Shimia thalassica]MDP2494643.1 hypothetical protein [Shimia thalassica]